MSRAAGILALIALAGALLLGLAWPALSFGRYAAAPAVLATVLRIEPGERGATPLVTYAVGGVTYTLRGAIAADPPAYTPGEAVEVRYQPADPADAMLAADIAALGQTSLLSGAGLGALALLLGWLALGRRRRGARAR